MDSQRIYDICHWNWQKGRVWGAKLDFFDQLIKFTGRRWAHFSALNVAKTFLLMLTCTYTRWEHMTQTHIHVKIVAKLWLERRPWTIIWGSTTLQWRGWKGLTNVKNAHMRPKIRPTWANTPNVCTVCRVKTKEDQEVSGMWRVWKNISAQRPFWHTCEITQRPS